jgi:hypothetical protein
MKRDTDIVYRPRKIGLLRKFRVMLPKLPASLAVIS